MMLELIPGRVDLWSVSLDDVQDRHLLDEYRAMLTSEEREEEERFRFAKDLYRYVVARTPVRTVLSRYAAIEPGRWRFRQGRRGKPFVANDEPEAQRISFNLSHTDAHVVLGVTGESALGVDVERIRYKRGSHGSAGAFLLT